MPTMEKFIDSITHEQMKLIQMGLIKEPKAHALTMQDGNGSSNQNSKWKGKEKHKEKEGYSKPFKDSLGSKDSSNSKGKKKKGKQCTYFN
jgi:hypothetical protein